MFNVMLTLSPELKMLPKPLTFSVREIPTGLPSGTVILSAPDSTVVMRLAGALTANNSHATVKAARYFVLMRDTELGSKFNQSCRSR